MHEIILTIYLALMVLLIVMFGQWVDAETNSSLDVHTTADITDFQTIIDTSETEIEDEVFTAPPDTYIDDSIYVKDKKLWARKTYEIGDKITVIECGDDCVEVRTPKDKYRIYADGKDRQQSRYPTLSEDSPIFYTCIRHSRELAWAHNVPFCEDL